MNKPHECERLLLEIAGRLNNVLLPSDFQFRIEDSGHSSAGPFSAGFFSHREIKIGLAYRWFGLGCVVYIVDNESISHDELMQALGLGRKYRLRYSPQDMVSYGKDGENPVDSLIHDLEEYFVPLFKRNRAFLLETHKAAFQKRTE